MTTRLFSDVEADMRLAMVQSWVSQYEMLLVAWERSGGQIRVHVHTKHRMNQRVRFVYQVYDTTNESEAYALFSASNSDEIMNTSRELAELGPLRNIDVWQVMMTPAPFPHLLDDVRPYLQELPIVQMRDQNMLGVQAVTCELSAPVETETTHTRSYVWGFAVFCPMVPELDVEPFHVPINYLGFFDLARSVQREPLQEEMLSAITHSQVFVTRFIEACGRFIARVNSGSVPAAAGLAAEKRART